MKNEIVVVSIGIVDPLGSNLNDNFNKFINGQSGIRPIENFKLSDYPIIKATKAGEINVDALSILHLKENERKHLDRYNLAGFYAAEQALLQTNYNSNTGIIFSSLGGGATSTLNCTVNLLNNKRSTPRQCLAAQRDNLTSLISRKFNLLGVNMCITSACASGIVSLDYAYKLLDDNTYDQMLVGGCDLMVDPMDIYMFQSIGALDIRENPKSCPFDLDRNGFIMGEGATCFILKTKARAIQDNDRILATLRGIGYANEAFHETNIHPEGLGAKISIDKAIEKSNISCTEIGIVNAHATSTKNGDEIEYNIIKSFFPNAVIQAIKSNIGHTMASCGLIELGYMIQSLNTGLTGGILNLNNPINNDVNLAYSPTKINSNFGIKNSFGFGGKSAAIIVEKGYDY